MRTKQHANGTTPVVRSVKKSAFHDVAFDTRIDVSCEREYTEQFAPRRDPIVFVFHDEFARIAQQLVNKKCHSTNAMHKMKMDPKTYTITDGMRFDTTAPVAQLPLSRQVRASASLDVEKREHRGELVPTNDHERRLVDVRPSNPHAYFDATRLGKGQRFDSKHPPRGATRESTVLLRVFEPRDARGVLCAVRRERAVDESRRSNRRWPAAHAARNRAPRWEQGEAAHPQTGRSDRGVAKNRPDVL